MTAYKRAASEPEILLGRAYHDYFTASTCYETRKGLAYQLVNEVDLAETQRAIEKIEEILKARKLTMDTDALWSKTVGEFGDPRFFIYFDPNVIAATESSPNPIAGALLRAMREEHSVYFAGSTGAERLMNFGTLLRNPRSRISALRVKCLDADQRVKKTLADLDLPSLAPTNDF